MLQAVRYVSKRSSWICRGHQILLVALGWTAGRDGESFLGPVFALKAILLTFLTLSDIHRYIYTYPGKMGRMYGNGKGLSRSALPYKRSAPSWLKVTSNEVSLDGHVSGSAL